MKTAPSLLAALSLLFAHVADAEPRRLVVNPSDPQAFATLAAAAGKLRPGDTLWIAPDSGPYREPLFITVSGTAAAPIVIEGNGNEITGFDPIGFDPLEDGRHVATLQEAYPFVLRHRGRRILESAVAGRFPEGVDYDRATRRLVLAAGTPIDGWEISSRAFAVRVSNVSHHRYRDIVASGSRNDGFNLHGSGRGLVFENIVGRQNLDEGFSAHATVEAEIDGGVFHENDNGMLSGQETVTRMRRIDCHHNLGIGLGFNGQATVEASQVRSWGNGMTQLLIREGVRLRWSEVDIYRNTYASRPLVSYMESARWQTPKTIDAPPGYAWSGGAPRSLEAVSPDEDAP